MELTCGAKVAKYLLFIFNIIFWLAGILFLVVSILILANVSIGNFQSFVSPSDGSLRTGAWVLLGVGIFMIVVGFCGCCGAIMENVLLLGLYVIFLIITIGVEIGIAIFVGVKRDQVYSAIQSSMVDVVQNIYQKDNTTRNAVDAVQQGSQCCGVYNHTDWARSTFFTSQNAATAKSAPDSCCRNVTDTACHVNKNYFTQGCLSAAENWIKTYYPILIGVAAGIAVFELLGLLMSCCLCSAIRNNKAMV